MDYVKFTSQGHEFVFDNVDVLEAPETDIPEGLHYGPRIVHNLKFISRGKKPSFSNRTEAFTKSLKSALEAADFEFVLLGFLLPTLPDATLKFALRSTLDGVYFTVVENGKHSTRRTTEDCLKIASLYYLAYENKCKMSYMVSGIKEVEF